MKNLEIKGCSVMKKTRESSSSQIGLIEKQNLVARLATMGITHVEITMLADSDTNLRAKGFIPSPRTIEAETQQWYDVIHAQDTVYGTKMKVYDRCVFPDMEGIVGYSVVTGRAAGTAASAPTDGESTWCGRYYKYLTQNVTTAKFENGDIQCPVPECTGPAFGTFWTTQAGLTSTLAEFEKIADSLYASVGKTCKFMTNPNFSEVTSGWCWNGTNLYSTTGYVCYDYYGGYRGGAYTTPADYSYEISETYAGRSLAGYGIGTGGIGQVFGEWGDLSGSISLGALSARSGDNYVSGTTNIEMWQRYLIQFYKALTVLVDAGKIKGFNYWGGWENQNTSLLWKTGSGDSSQYYLNTRGQILRNFFISGGMPTGRQPVPVAGSYSEADPSFGGRNMYF